MCDNLVLLNLGAGIAVGETYTWESTYLSLAEVNRLGQVKVLSVLSTDAFQKQGPDLQQIKFVGSFFPCAPSE